MCLRTVLRARMPVIRSRRFPALHRGLGLGEGERMCQMKEPAIVAAALTGPRPAGSAWVGYASFISHGNQGCAAVLRTGIPVVNRHPREGGEGEAASRHLLYRFFLFRYKF